MGNYPLSKILWLDFLLYTSLGKIEKVTTPKTLYMHSHTSMSELNLYLVTWGSRKGYDTYSSFVVCCENAKDARNTHPGSGEIGKWNVSNDGCGTWIPLELKMTLEVQKIGQAEEGMTPRIVCKSFHAG